MTGVQDVCSSDLAETSEVPALKNLSVFVAVLSALAAISAAVIAVVLFLDKKRKDEEELEHYLDCSIQ